MVAKAAVKAVKVVAKAAVKVVAKAAVKVVARAAVKVVARVRVEVALDMWEFNWHQLIRALVELKELEAKEEMPTRAISLAN